MPLTLDEMAVTPKRRPLTLDEMATTPSLEMPQDITTEQEIRERAGNTFDIATKLEIPINVVEQEYNTFGYLTAGPEEGALKKFFRKFIREPITKYTGFFAPDISPIDRRYFREDISIPQQLAAVASRTGAKALSGRYLYLPDLAAKWIGKKAFGPDTLPPNSLAELIDEFTGVIPTQKEELAGEIVGTGFGLQTASKTVGNLIMQLPARNALKILLSSGAVFGTETAAKEAVNSVNTGLPVDWQDIHFNSGIGVLFGTGEIVAIAVLSKLLPNMNRTYDTARKMGLEEEAAQVRRDANYAREYYREHGEMPPELMQKYVYGGKSPKATTQAEVGLDFGKNPIVFSGTGRRISETELATLQTPPDSATIPPMAQEQGAARDIAAKEQPKREAESKIESDTIYDIADKLKIGESKVLPDGRVIVKSSIDINYGNVYISRSDVPIEQLRPTETLDTSKMEGAERSAKLGTVKNAPPIHISPPQIDPKTGKIFYEIEDGHQRYLQAEAAGEKTLKAMERLPDYPEDYPALQSSFNPTAPQSGGATAEPVKTEATEDYFSLQKAEMERRKANVPELIKDILARNDKDVSWVLRTATKEQRDAVDKWLVDTAHPLAMEAGSQEGRIRAIVQELSPKQETKPANKPTLQELAAPLIERQNKVWKQLRAVGVNKLGRETNLSSQIKQAASHTREGKKLVKEYDQLTKDISKLEEDYALGNPSSTPEARLKDQGGGSSGMAGFPGAPSRTKLNLEKEPVQTGKTVSATEIIKHLAKAFNVPIHGMATHKPRMAAGWYEIRPQGIRQINVTSLDTAAHEIGHHVDHAFNIRTQKTGKTGKVYYAVPDGTSQELVKLGKELYGARKPVGGYKSEGVAEFVRRYISNDIDNLKIDTPNFLKWFEEDYLPNQTEIANAIANSQELYKIYSQQGARARVRSQRTTKGIPNTIAESTSKILNRVETDFRDEFAPLLRGMENAGINPDTLKPTDDPHFLATVFADKAGSKARFFALQGTTDMSGKITGPSLEKVLQPVADDIERFLDWAHAAKALQWQKLGLNAGLNIDDARYIYEKDINPVYEKALADFTKWNQSGLDLLVESGAMPKEIANAIKEKHPIYIPLIRAFEEGEVRRGGGMGKGLSNVGKPIKKAKGSGRPAVDMVMSSVSQMEKIISTAQKTMVMRALAKLSNKKGIAGLIWEVPAPQEATTFTAEKIKDDVVRLAQDKLGIELDGIPSGLLETWDDLITVFTNASTYKGKDNLISIVMDGKRQWYEISPDLYSVLQGLDQYTLPPVLDWVFGKPTRAVRLGATGINAAFGLIRNPLRDMMTFAVLSKHAKYGPLAVLDSMKGLASDVGTQVASVMEKYGVELPKSKVVERFEALGGDMSVQIMHDRRGQRHLRSRVLASNGKRYTIYTVLHPVDALREVVGLSETANRVAEFGPAYTEGERLYGKDSIDAAYYALFHAQDVTTNFTRHGRLMKVINQVEPFTNAAVQGADKLYRTIKERPLRTTLTGLGVLTLPALYLWWQNKDKAWYKSLPDYEKYGYQHYEVDSDTIVRWPVPFELGHIFQTLPVAAFDAAYREDPTIISDAAVKAFELSNPFGWPAAIKPWFDLGANKDFSGRPIVPRSVEGKEPQDQYAPNTTELMKLFGKQLDLSPAQIEHLVNSYSGGTYVRTAKILEPRKQEWTLSDMPVLGTLFLRDPYAPKKQIEKFYTKREELNRKFQSKTITPAEDSERHIIEKIARDFSKDFKALAESQTISERKKIYSRMQKDLEKILNN